MPKTFGETVKYTVEIYKSPKGYHLACPALSGCVSQGDSLPQAMENMKKAIREYLLKIKRSTRNKTTAEVQVVV
ncbi:MAG TPA: type II toxin-antitoxin system HicB family antitoxin [Nitrospiria bacterium]|nr:type II toxin-antitoxin system HicB family antitoxin [Nitrospiria bacterium]